MARATKEEALNAKIAKNAQAIAKVVEKLDPSLDEGVLVKEALKKLVK